MSVELAALTIASSVSRVMSPTRTRTRPPRKSAFVCCDNEDSTRPPKKIHAGRLRGNVPVRDLPFSRSFGPFSLQRNVRPNARERASGEGRRVFTNSFARALLPVFAVEEARLDAYVVEHVLSPERLGDAARLALGERVLGVCACDLEESVVNHLDAELSERDAGDDDHLVQVVHAEAPRLLDPVFDERVAQGVQRLGHVEVRAFGNQAILAGVLSLHGVSSEPRDRLFHARARKGAPPTNFNTDGRMMPKNFDAKAKASRRVFILPTTPNLEAEPQRLKLRRDSVTEFSTPRFSR